MWWKFCRRRMLITLLQTVYMHVLEVLSTTNVDYLIADGVYACGGSFVDDEC